MSVSVSMFAFLGCWRGPSAPVQNERAPTIPMPIAEEAWKEYAAQGHGDQSLQRINERAGFGIFEVAALLYDRCKRLEAENRKDS